MHVIEFNEAMLRFFIFGTKACWGFLKGRLFALVRCVVLYVVLPQAKCLPGPHQEAVLESLEAGVSGPLRVGGGDAADVGHVLEEGRKVVHLHVCVHGKTTETTGGRGARGA